MPKKSCSTFFLMKERGAASSNLPTFLSFDFLFVLIRLVLQFTSSQRSLDLSYAWCCHRFCLFHCCCCCYCLAFCAKSIRLSHNSQCMDKCVNVCAGVCVCVFFFFFFVFLFYLMCYRRLMHLCNSYYLWH